MSRRFVRSEYLCSVERQDDWAIYHSLFGNLRFTNRTGMDLLDAFARPATIAQVCASRSNSADLMDLANQMVVLGFLVPEGADEYAVIDSNMALRREHLASGYLVRTLQLVLTNRCNFRCKYCFIDFGTPEPAETAPAQDDTKAMSWEVAEQSMRETLAVLRRNGNRLLTVEFFGGEPLMNWPVIRRVLDTFGNGDPDDVAIHYSVTTNGALVTAEMAEMFRRYGVTVTLSIDETAHGRPSPLAMDTTNQPPGWATSGDKIRRALDLLKAAGTTITFNTVLSSETAHAFDGRRLLDFASESGAAMVGLILDLKLDFYRSAENRALIAGILERTQRYGREIGVRVGGYWYQIFAQLSGEQAINLRTGYKTCPATGCKISVEPDGTVHSCKCCAEPIGSVADLGAVLSSPRYADYALQAYRNAPECAGCEIDGFCSGTCMGSLEKDYKRLDVIENGACTIFREVTRRLIRNHPATEEMVLAP